MENNRLRGWIGEQSFEIQEGVKHLRIFAEAQVFSAAYRTEREAGAVAMEARERASIAVKTFQRQRAEDDGKVEDK